jgi:hypothetical protein
MLATGHKSLSKNSLYVKSVRHMPNLNFSTAIAMSERIIFKQYFRNSLKECL